MKVRQFDFVNFCSKKTFKFYTNQEIQTAFLSFIFFTCFYKPIIYLVTKYLKIKHKTVLLKLS